MNNCTFIAGGWYHEDFVPGCELPQGEDADCPVNYKNKKQDAPISKHKTILNKIKGIIAIVFERCFGKHVKQNVDLSGVCRPPTKTINERHINVINREDLKCPSDNYVPNSNTKEMNSVTQCKCTTLRLHLYTGRHRVKQADLLLESS